MLKGGSQPQLEVHEWLAALIIISLIVLLSFLSFCTSIQNNNIEIASPHHIIDPMVIVDVKGEVQFPGRYSVKKGTTIKELLNMAILSEDSCISNLKLGAKITRARVIRIKKRKKK